VRILVGGHLIEDIMLTNGSLVREVAGTIVKKRLSEFIKAIS
jgi:hypothetical protein